MFDFQYIKENNRQIEYRGRKLMCSFNYILDVIIVNFRNSNFTIFLFKDKIQLDS